MLYLPWVFAAGVAVLMALIAAGTVHSGLVLRQWTPASNLLLSWPDNLLRLTIIGFCVGWGWLFGPGPAALGWLTRQPVFDLAAGAVAGLVLSLLLAAAGWLAVKRWGPGISSTKMVQCILPANGREWLGVLPALLVAAALEELLFRSLPLGGMARLVPPWWLLWPLSLCFGFLHWPQGWWGVVGASLAAVGLSLLFLISGSIWMPLAAHYVMNVTQIVLAAASGVRPLRA